MEGLPCPRCRDPDCQRALSLGVTTTPHRACARPGGVLRSRSPRRKRHHWDSPRAAEEVWSVAADLVPRGSRRLVGPRGQLRSYVTARARHSEGDTRWSACSTQAALKATTTSCHSL